MFEPEPLVNDDPVLASEPFGAFRCQGTDPVPAAGGQAASREEGQPEVRRVGSIRGRKFRGPERHAASSSSGNEGGKVRTRCNIVLLCHSPFQDLK